MPIVQSTGNLDDILKDLTPEQRAKMKEAYKNTDFKMIDKTGGVEKDFMMLAIAGIAVGGVVLLVMLKK